MGGSVADREALKSVADIALNIPASHVSRVITAHLGCKKSSCHLQTPKNARVSEGWEIRMLDL